MSPRSAIGVDGVGGASLRQLLTLDRRARSFAGVRWCLKPNRRGGEFGPGNGRCSRQAVAEARAAEAALELAHNRAVADLTLRAGCVHDRFGISGNQQNSLFVGVSVPMPFGQTDARAREKHRGAP